MGFSHTIIGIVEAKNEKSAIRQARQIAKEDGIYLCSGGVEVHEADEDELKKYCTRKPTPKKDFMEILKDVIEEKDGKFNIKRPLTAKEEEALHQVYEKDKFTIIGLKLDDCGYFGWGIEKEVGSGKFTICEITEKQEGK